MKPKMSKGRKFRPCISVMVPSVLWHISSCITFVVWHYKTLGSHQENLWVLDVQWYSCNNDQDILTSTSNLVTISLSYLQKLDCTFLCGEVLSSFVSWSIKTSLQGQRGSNMPYHQNWLNHYAHAHIHHSDLQLFTGQNMWIFALVWICWILCFDNILCLTSLQNGRCFLVWNQHALPPLVVWCHAGGNQGSSMKWTY
jgi:hypothetical protein